MLYDIQYNNYLFMIFTIKLITVIYRKLNFCIFITPQGDYNGIKALYGSRPKMLNVYTSYLCEISIATGQLFVTSQLANYHCDLYINKVLLLANTFTWQILIYEDDIFVG